MRCDDELVLSLVERYLIDDSYLVLTASNGPNAVQQSRDFKGEIQLLLSDFEMPGMSGIQLATELTVDRPEIRVLLMSGFKEGILVLNEGWHFLPKRFVRSQLRALVATILSQNRESRFSDKGPGTGAVQNGKEGDKGGGSASEG